MSERDAAVLRRRNRELSILNTIAQALNRSVDMSQALQAVLAQVAELLDLHTGWVWLLSEYEGEAELAAIQNLPPALKEKPERMTGDCYCLRTFVDGDLAGAANVNVVECSRLQGLVDGTENLRYHASIPLYASGEKLGVLNVAATDWRRLSPADLQLLHTVGDMLGIAIERARLFDKSAQLGAAEERNRLAREIHETLAQGLTAVALQLEISDVMLEKNGDLGEARQAVQKALSLTRINLEEARRSVLNLRAAPLEGRTLSEALAVLVKDANLTARFKCSGKERPLPLQIEIGIFRIAQEALTNVNRHAQATSMTMALAFFADAVQLIVVDDGRGFDLTAVPEDRFGLLGMRERVRLLGGQISIETHLGAGVKIQVDIPDRAVGE